MALVDNLYALRKFILRSFLGIVIATVALMPLMQPIFNYALFPLTSVLNDHELIAVSVISPVLTPLKVVLFCAFVVSMPHTLLQFWNFIAPALYKREKRKALGFIFSSMLMFVLGVAYCYEVVFNFLFNFIIKFAPESISVSPDIDEYLSFVLHMFTAFGLAFETPILVLMLNLTGMVSLNKLKHLRRYIVVIAFVIAAILTPPDITSQLLLALPLIALYELGLLLCSIVSKINSKEVATIS